MIMNMFLIIVLLLQGLIGVGDTGIPCTKVLCPNEANSSPSHIIATKGSSVWLHWNYTYIGDGRHGLTTLTYKEQIIGFNSTSQPTVQTLAKRIGQNGALILESPVPPPFNGRVEVISSNSTLVIHNLQNSDSVYQFSSSVKVDGNAGGGNNAFTYSLEPYVSITVNEAPDLSTDGSSGTSNTTTGRFANTTPSTKKPTRASEAPALSTDGSSGTSNVTTGCFANTTPSTKKPTESSGSGLRNWQIVAISFGCFFIVLIIVFIILCIKKSARSSADVELNAAKNLLGSSADVKLNAAKKQNNIELLSIEEN